MKKTALPLTLIILAGCASQPPPSYRYYLDQKGLGPQTPESFQHCHGYGCQYIAEVTFSQQDWAEIKRIFSANQSTPEIERETIKAAIALFEQKVGAQTGTDVDYRGTFRKTGRYQLDCVDESTNTTIYLSLLQQKGLLKHHRVESPTARFPIIHAGRWPHQTAVISELKTGQSYVVDSWFHNNGAPPEIVSLKQWKEGWKPKAPDDTL